MTSKYADIDFQTAPVVVIDRANYQVTTLGMITKNKIAFEEWEFLGVHLGNVQKGIQWALGDWIVYGQGQPEWQHMWTQALDQTHLSLSTLQSYRWLASKFPMARRRIGLSWEHHQAVGALTTEDQDSLLDQAADQGWSVRDLRDAIAGRAVSNPLQQLPELDSDKPQEERSMQPKKKKQWTMGELKNIFVGLPPEQQASFKKWLLSF